MARGVPGQVGCCRNVGMQMDEQMGMDHHELKLRKHETSRAMGQTANVNSVNTSCALGYNSFHLQLPSFAHIKDCKF
jgi:hypothetical protein